MPALLLIETRGRECAHEARRQLADAAQARIFAQGFWFWRRWRVAVLVEDGGFYPDEARERVLDFLVDNRVAQRCLWYATAVEGKSRSFWRVGSRQPSMNDHEYRLWAIEHAAIQGA